MRFALAALATLCALHAQTFDPKMPAAVPEVSGKVAEAATLRYIDVKIGDGPAASPGQECTVHYTGWLRDGKQFDSSVGKDPLKFVQGLRQVISGWDMGFEGMKVGGKRRLFIPYQMAYGEKGRGSIPPKAELIFDVELLAVKDVPPPSAAGDLIFPFEDMEKEVLELAKAVPEDKYSWRPGPGVRSFGEAFLHIAFGNQLLLNIAGGATKDDAIKQADENAKNESKPMTKDQIVQALTESFSAVRKTLENARAGGLSRTVDFFGRSTTQRSVLALLDTHIAEHLGQCIAYARVNGIVPPWSLPRK